MLVGVLPEAGCQKTNENPAPKPVGLCSVKPVKRCFLMRGFNCPHKHTHTRLPPCGSVVSVGFQAMGGSLTVDTGRGSFTTSTTIQGGKDFKYLNWLRLKSSMMDGSLHLFYYFLLFYSLYADVIEMTLQRFFPLIVDRHSGRQLMCVLPILIAVCMFYITMIYTLCHFLLCSIHSLLRESEVAS